MQAKQLHEVLARVVAWHNRHPLALRISPTQVHSIGGVALPFASDVRPEQPPTLSDVLDPSADADAAFAALLADADAVIAPPDAHGEPGADRAAEPPTGDVPLPEIEPAPEVTSEAATESEPAPPPGVDAPGSDPAEPAPEAPADDNAPLELAMALDEVAAQADAEAAAALAEASGAAQADAAAEPAAAPDAPPTDDTPTEVLASGAPDTAEATPAEADPAAAAEASAGDPGTTPAEDAPLAERLQAARERAMTAGSPGADATLDIPLDTVTHAGAQAPASHTAAPAGALPAAAPSRHWLARLWAGLPLALARRRGQAQAGAGAESAAAPAGQLAPLFSEDFMWPRTPRQVARWVQRHGAQQPLAPADWPQRQIETDAALLQAARRKGLPHAVTRHVLTAAVGVGDRRIRLLIDADGRILGPRAFDRRRIGLLGSGGTALAAVALVAVLGPWRQRAAHDGAEMAAHAGAAASAASAALAEGPGDAASAAHGAMAAASAASAAHDGQAHADAAPAADHGGHGKADAAHTTAAPAAASTVAQAASHANHADHTGPTARAAHAEAPGHAEAPVAPASMAAATPAAPAAPVSVVRVTTEPPPAWPVTRASGPLVAIRFRLSDEAKQAARAEVAAARAAIQGGGHADPQHGAAAAPVSLPPQGPAAPRPGPQETAVRVARQPGTVFAVVTPAMPQRESAEAILAQMMSVRARLSPSAPDHGEVLAHQGRWRAAWWPFATEADAERARAMLVARGMRAEVIEF